MASGRDLAALRHLSAMVRCSHARELLAERQLRDLLEHGTVPPEYREANVPHLRREGTVQEVLTRRPENLSRLPSG